MLFSTSAFWTPHMCMDPHSLDEDQQHPALPRALYWSSKHEPCLLLPYISVQKSQVKWNLKSISVTKDCPTSSSVKWQYASASRQTDEWICLKQGTKKLFLNNLDQYSKRPSKHRNFQISEVDQKGNSALFHYSILGSWARTTGPNPFQHGMYFFIA